MESEGKAIHSSGLLAIDPFGVCSIILTGAYYHAGTRLDTAIAMKNISLKLPDDLHAKLEWLANERGAAKSDVVRQALEAYFVSPQNGSKLSCLDLARDLVGCIDGPPDLATNPKYLRGFGK
jgi:hypothetical protein